MSYPPPPQGGYPQQPQQPYPQQGGYAYPPQQQVPPQPYPQQAPQQGWGAPPQPPIPQGPAPARGGGGGGGDNDSIKKNLFKIVGLLVVIGVIWAGASWFSRSDAKNAAVGDCMKNTSSSSKANLDIVDCGSSEAQYKVMAVRQLTSVSDCDDFDFSYTERYGTRKHRKTVLLCLNELKK